MNPKILASAIALSCLLPPSSTAAATPAQDYNEGYRYQITVEGSKGEKLMTIRTGAFTFGRKISAIAAHYESRDEISVICTHEVSLFVEKAIKVNPEGTKETISNPTTILIDPPYLIWFTDYNAPLKDSTGVYRGVLTGSLLFFAPENCSEKKF